jgi:hypothetical protein
VRQLADHWRESLEETLRRVVREGIDISMAEKANDEQHASSMPRQYGPSGDLDDDLDLMGEQDARVMMQRHFLRVAQKRKVQ